MGSITIDLEPKDTYEVAWWSPANGRDGSFHDEETIVFDGFVPNVGGDMGQQRVDFDAQKVYIRNVVARLAGNIMALSLSTDIVKGGEVYTAKPGDDLVEVSNKLHAGDTLLLHGGVYHIHEFGQIRPNASGKSWEKPITIAAYPGEKPILDGTFVLEGKWEKYRDAIYSLDLQAAGCEKPGNVRFSHSTKGYPVSPVYMEILWQDGPPGQGRPIVHQIALSLESGNQVYPQERLKSFFSIYGKGLGAVDESGEFYYSPDEHKLYLWLHDGDDPNNHVIRAPYGARTSLIGLPDKEYYIIRDLTLRGSAGSGIYTRGINHFRLENTEISYMGGQLSLGNDVIIRSCHFHHGFYNVAQGTGEGFVFEGNEVTDNPTLSQKAYTLQELIKMAVNMGADFSNVPAIGR